MLAFALVHEMPSADTFFREVSAALKPGGRVLFAEPAGHIKASEFEKELAAAFAAGLTLESRPEISRSQAAVLKRV